MQFNCVNIAIDEELNTKGHATGDWGRVNCINAGVMVIDPECEADGISSLPPLLVIAPLHDLLAPFFFVLPAPAPPFCTAAFALSLAFFRSGAINAA